MKRVLPTESEISVYGSLDEQCALKHFLGKDLNQAEAMFRDNFLVYQEDLMWMGPKAFCFYVDAAIAYLLSPAADGDADAVRCFYSAVEFQRQYYSDEIAPAVSNLKAAIKAILNDFERFECDTKIDGDLASHYQTLLARL